MSAANDPLSEARSLRKAGNSPRALAVLREAIRGGSLTAEEIDKCGRFIAKELARGDAGQPVLRVLILGQCTTSWLVPALTAVAWGGGQAVLVEEGEYDNVLQDVNQAAERAPAPDFLVLLPWNQRLLADSPARSADERVDDELAFWKQAWALAERLGSRLIQVGYDWIHPGPTGYLLSRAPDSDVGRVRQANAALHANLPEGAALVDLELISGAMGREQFYDFRRYCWTKQPFSEAGVVRLAEHLFAALRALHVGPKKVLVVDLDNTLWGGVVGETGPLGVELGESPDGEAYRAFQKYIQALTRQGTLLAVSSKNNPADAREPFGVNPNMALTLDDFAAFEAHWDPKSESLRRIAATLRLGIDSFVFFDDNPFEQDQVRQALPEVSVVRAPTDPADFVRALESGLYFESVRLTDADRERAEQYRVERARRTLEESFTSLDDYLRSLEMRAVTRPIDDADMSRVVQLLAKTNQFNLTTRRHGEAEVRERLRRPGAFGLTFRLADRFGDYGLISVVLAVPDKSDPEGLCVDVWLMSCRVIGRTMEQFIAGEMVVRARQGGFERLIGEFIPTAKNALVADLYERLGFKRLPASGDSQRFVLDIASAAPAATFVSPDTQ